MSAATFGSSVESKETDVTTAAECHHIGRATQWFFNPLLARRNARRSTTNGTELLLTLFAILRFSSVTQVDQLSSLPPLDPLQKQSIEGVMAKSTPFPNSLR